LAFCQSVARGDEGMKVNRYVALFLFYTGICATVLGFAVLSDEVVLTVAASVLTAFNLINAVANMVPEHRGTKVEKEK